MINISTFDLSYITIDSTLPGVRLEDGVKTWDPIPTLSYDDLNILSGDSIDWGNIPTTPTGIVPPIGIDLKPLFSVDQPPYPPFPSYENLTAPPPQKPFVYDENVYNVRNLLEERMFKGYNKYGTTTMRKDIDMLGWLQHLQEELLDAAVYVERLKKECK